jgi:hypothetical protein
MGRFRIWDLGFRISARSGGRALAAVAAIAVFACQGSVFVEEQKRQSGTQRNVIPVETVSKTDILFLVDNSGSMSQEQDNLAENFAAFIEEILKGQNDFHIGIVTTEVLTEVFGRPCPPGGICANGMECTPASSDSGAVKAGNSYCVKECESDDDCQNHACSQQSGDCTPSMCGELLGFAKGQKYCYPVNNGRLRFNACKKGYSEDLDDRCEYQGRHEKVFTSRLKNDLGDEDFKKMFRDNVRMGTNGSGLEQGLQALMNALDPDYVDPATGRNLVDHENKGFLRPEARLTIIVVSDEEDCSRGAADPNFPPDRMDNNYCYPSPNTCHPDCTLREVSTGCFTGFDPPEQEVMAEENAEFGIQKGLSYCMIPCSADDDCANAPVEGMKCRTVPGFGNVRKYCNCRFDETVANSKSKYAHLAPTQDFGSFFRSLKKNPSDVNMAVIIGAAQSGSRAGEPDNCWSPDGVACAGRRYHEVASGMSEFLSDSICQSDFKETLIKIARVLIISNERVLSDEPFDPTCIEVKVGGTAVPHCGVLSSCGTSGAGAAEDGVSDKTCPEAAVFCEGGAACEDKEGTPCDCAAISDPKRGCRCVGGGGECRRPIFWEYIPPEDCSTGNCCKENDAPKIVFHGCGLEAGDKLEINFLAGGTTTAGGAATCE